jgi:hypothetical protein
MTRSLEELPVSGDVVLYSFPKCGRTWVRYMYVYLFREHLAATHLTKIIDRSKHIILIRRFEDVLVSYYFEVLHRHGFGETDIDGAMARTWSESRRAGMLATLGALERLPIGKRWHDRIASARKDRSLMLLFRICVDVFFEHYRYWLEQDGQKLVLRYEDLRADPIGNLRRLVDFVGRVPSVDLAQAVDQASFERMRKLELSGEGIRGDGFWLPVLTTRNKDNPEALKTREGKVDGYLAHFSQGDIRQIEGYIAKHHAEVAAAYGYAYGRDTSLGSRILRSGIALCFPAIAQIAPVADAMM